jgi:hypothetical protein
MPAGGVAQVIEHLLSKHEILNSNTRTNLSPTNQTKKISAHEGNRAE